MWSQFMILFAVHIFPFCGTKIDNKSPSGSKAKRLKLGKGNILPMWTSRKGTLPLSLSKAKVWVELDR